MLLTCIMMMDANHNMLKFNKIIKLKDFSKKMEVFL